MKLDFSRRVSEKKFKCKISRKSVRWELSCSIWRDGRTDGRRERERDRHDGTSSRCSNFAKVPKIWHSSRQWITENVFLINASIILKRTKGLTLRSDWKTGYTSVKTCFDFRQCPDRLCVTSHLFPGRQAIFPRESSRWRVNLAIQLLYDSWHCRTIDWFFRVFDTALLNKAVYIHVQLNE